MLTLPGFEGSELVGAGSCGEVYSAWDVQLERMVAIKVLRPELAAAPEHRQQFVDEARHLARLAGTQAESRLMQVYSFGEADDRPFFVMPFADRGSLSERMRLSERAAVADRVDAALQVIDVLAVALRAVHDDGLVHRDVKPGNILIQSVADLVESTASSHPSAVIKSDEELLLGDLGLAESYDDPTMLARLPLACGTPGYMPPEAIDPEGVWSPKSDVYSATATVIFVLTGRSASEDWEDALYGAGLGAALEYLQRGLALNPDDRYDSIQTWAVDIGGVLGRLNDQTVVRAQPAEPVQTLEQAVPSRPSLWNKRANQLVVGLVVLVGIVVTGYFLQSGSDDISSPEVSADGPAETVEPEVEPVLQAEAEAEPEAEPEPEVESEPEAEPEPEVEPAPPSAISLNCTVVVADLPTGKIERAVVGQDVPAVGDCESFELWTWPIDVEVTQPWSEVLLTRCAVAPADDAQGFSMYLKFVGEPEFEMTADRGASVGPSQLEHIRWEATEQAGTGENSWIGSCSGKGNLGASLSFNFIS